MSNSPISCPSSAPLQFWGLNSIWIRKVRHEKRVYSFWIHGIDIRSRDLNWFFSFCSHILTLLVLLLLLLISSCSSCHKTSPVADDFPLGWHNCIGQNRFVPNYLSPLGLGCKINNNPMRMKNRAERQSFPLDGCNQLDHLPVNSIKARRSRRSWSCTRPRKEKTDWFKSEKFTNPRQMNC